MKMLKSRKMRLVAGMGALVAPLGGTAVTLTAGPASAVGEGQATTAGTYDGTSEIVSEFINGQTEVYGNLRVRVTLDGANHITDVGVLESPGTAAAAAMLASANGRLASANASLTNAKNSVASSATRLAAAKKAAAKAKTAVKKAKGKKKKAAQKRYVAAVKSVAAASNSLAAANGALGSANGAVADANAAVSAAQAEMTAHETSQNMSDYALPSLHDDALYALSGRANHVITSANVLSTTDIQATTGASATEAAFRKSLQAALLSAGA